MDEVFFCNSGCEANEAAIKVARQYGHDKGIEAPAIIVMEKAFHGRTIATLSATGSRKVQAGFEPLVQGFVRVPLDDLDAVRQVAAHNRNVVAVLVEPIQGEGGINVSRLDYLRGLREICDAQRLAAHARRGAERHGPHRQVVRLPARRRPARRGDARQGPRQRRAGRRLRGRRRARKGVFKPGNHGSTFGGNPLACAPCVTTLDTIEEDGLMRERRERRRAASATALREQLGRHAGRARHPRHGPDDRHRARASPAASW